MTDSQSIVPADGALPVPMSVAAVVGRVASIHAIARGCLKDDVDYFSFSSTGKGQKQAMSKPVLTKAGCEKLLLAFHLSSASEVKTIDLEGGHKEFHAVCTVRTIQNGLLVAQSPGMCSTRESKYMYESSKGAPLEVPPSKAMWNIFDDVKDNKQGARDEFNRLGIEQCAGAGLTDIPEGTNFWVKNVAPEGADKDWRITIKDGEKEPVKNPADKYPTCFQMAVVRAFRQAVRAATASSEIFGGDVEGEESNSRIGQIVEAINTGNGLDEALRLLWKCLRQVGENDTNQLLNLRLYAIELMKKLPIQHERLEKINKELHRLGAIVIELKDIDLPDEDDDSLDDEPDKTKSPDKPEDPAGKGELLSEKDKEPSVRPMRSAGGSGSSSLRNAGTKTPDGDGDPPK